MPTLGLTVPAPGPRSNEAAWIEWARQINVAVSALIINAQSRIVATGSGTLAATDPDLTVSLTRDSGEQLHARVSAWCNGSEVVVGPPGSDLEARLASTGADALTYSLTLHNGTSDGASLSITYEYVVTGIRTVFTASEQVQSDDPATYVAGGDDLTIQSTADTGVSVAS